jgi:3-oxoacyl-[acyl-carrier protein] reductase
VSQTHLVPSSPAARSVSAALSVRADVTDDLDVARLFDETNATFGVVDVVVHAAIHSAALVTREAARRLRHGGTIISLSSADAIPLLLARELRARDITIIGPAPGPESPGGDHDVADLVALLDRSRRSPAE